MEITYPVSYNQGTKNCMWSVSVLQANWSLWKKQQGKRVPLGFWSRKFPEAGRNCTIFEKELLAYYWALIDMEQLTIDHNLILRPQVPVMQWVQSSPQIYRNGQVQESSIMKWKFYIQEQAKPGSLGVAALLERISEIL